MLRYLLCELSVVPAFDLRILSTLTEITQPIWFVPYKVIFSLLALPIVPSVHDHSD